MSWRKRLTPLTLGLLAFGLFDCVLVNLALRYSPWQPQLYTTLQYTEAYFQGIALDDSWRPMRAALAYLDAPGPQPLYSTTFFERGVKFQYPPTSLLFLDALRRLPGVRGLSSNSFLNLASALAAFATALICARILVLGSRRISGDPSDDTPDVAALTVLAVAISLAFYPLVRSVYLGQLQTWIDLLFAALLWAWLADRKEVSGVLAGLICLLKPNLALLLVWGLLRRQWRFTSYMTATAGLFGLLSLWLYGLEHHLDYLEFLSFISQHGEAFQANQSLNGLLNRALFNGSNLEFLPDAFAPYNIWVHAGTLASSVALITLALFWRRGESRGADATDLMIAALTFTLASPVVWEHHYGIALPIFAVGLPAVLSAALDPRFARRAVPALAIAFLLISNNYRLLNRLAETSVNFVQSYVLLGGLVLLGFLYALRHAQHEGRST